MNTGSRDERQMLTDIHRIADALERIEKTTIDRRAVPVLVLEGEALDQLAWLFTEMKKNPGPAIRRAGGVYRLRITYDGGIRIKVNEATWSPGLTSPEPEFYTSTP